MKECYIIAFAVSFLLSLVITPIIRNIFKYFNLTDRPGKRKLHHRDIPSSGGIAIYISIIVTIGILYFFNIAFRDLLFSYNFLQKVLSGIIIGSTIILLLGVIDDRKSLNPLTKLLVQIIVILITIEYGIKIVGIKIPLIKTYILLPIFFSILVTTIWMVVFINSINLIDGIDGLAAGVVAIGSIVFFIVTFLQINKQLSITVTRELILVGILCLSLGGAVLGFLRYNFPPSTVFMGDTGSMLIGYFLGTVTILGILKLTATISIFIPILIIAFPILETLFTAIRRLKMKKSLFQPDKDHIHHRLLAYGYSAKQIVIGVYIFSSILGIGAIILSLK